LKKAERIAEFVQGLADAGIPGIDPHLAGYLECFNSGLYYEAHDVLEDLWLRQGKEHPDHGFHKGLIQLAGGFVHLRLQFLHPHHPKHGRRLAPARRLLILASGNLRNSGGASRGIHSAQAIALAEDMADRIGSNPPINPWTPDSLPLLGPGFRQ